ncbi:MAG: hypothetical protein IJ730_01480 [Alphaproteobacteria bacterium]|nr:hypothetical protein [Alphaproteobacteria bacterium]
MEQKLLIYVCACTLFYTDNINAANRGRGPINRLTPYQQRRVLVVRQSDRTEQQQSSGKDSQVSAELLQQMKDNEKLKEQISAKEKIEDLVEIMPTSSTSSSSTSSVSASSTPVHKSNIPFLFNPKLVRQVNQVKQLKDQKNLSNVDKEDSGFEILNKELRTEISDLHKIQEANELSAISEESLQHLQPAIRKEITKMIMINDPNRLPDELFCSVPVLNGKKGVGIKLKTILAAKDITDIKDVLLDLHKNTFENIDAQSLWAPFRGGVVYRTLKVDDIESIKSHLAPLLGNILLMKMDFRTKEYLTLLKSMIFFFKEGKKGEKDNTFTKVHKDALVLLKNVIILMLKDATYEQLRIK